MNCKTSTAVIIDWQPFQHSLFLFLLRIFIILPTLPIPTLANPQTTTALKIQVMMLDESS